MCNHFQARFWSKLIIIVPYVTCNISQSIPAVPRCYFICPTPGFGSGRNWSLGQVRVQYAKCPCEPQQQSSHHCPAPLPVEGKSWSGPIWLELAHKSGPLHAEEAHRNAGGLSALALHHQGKLLAGVRSIITSFFIPPCQAVTLLMLWLLLYATHDPYAICRENYMSCMVQNGEESLT